MFIPLLIQAIVWGTLLGLLTSSVAPLVVFVVLAFVLSLANIKTTPNPPRSTQPLFTWRPK